MLNTSSCKGTVSKENQLAVDSAVKGGVNTTQSARKRNLAPESVDNLLKKKDGVTIMDELINIELGPGKQPLSEKQNIKEKPQGLVLKKVETMQCPKQADSNTDELLSTKG